jgi:Kef-type K+ transport system membrane component KefB
LTGDAPRPSFAGARSLILKYLLLVMVPAAAILLVLRLGSALPPAAVPTNATLASPHGAASDAAAMPRLGLLLLQLLVVLVTTRACGVALRRLGQPQVVGEMLAGILLGPSFFGWLAPAAAEALFPPSSLGILSALSQVGMVLFMFLVGSELDPRALKERSQAAILTSHASIVVPFALGVALALPLYRRFAPPGVPFMVFASFLGAAMSVTAFPVLARILAERGMLRTPLGTLATAAAAVDDVTAWTILAAIVVLARAGAAETPPWLPVLGVTAFVAAVYLVRKPVRRRISAAFERRGRLTHDQVAILVGLVLVGASVTEAAGVHALFGAFFIGLALAGLPRVAHDARERLEAPLVVVLLPLYFAFTGLRTRLGLLAESDLWGWALAVLAVAVLGKLGGSAVAARMTGVPAREALALGALMNTRGLMELVILNIGLDLGVLSPALYSMMVLMALATTLMTSPLLAALGVPGPPTRTHHPRPPSASPTTGSD